jgi:peptidoglycan/xylan/chitin deacetylase (PgdA/CDA1 family)
MPKPMVPILMYHELSDTHVQYKYTISIDNFREQLFAIREAGKQGISIDDFVSGCKDQSVVITFDDGHATDLSFALPLLKEYGFNATFFISTGNIGISNKWLTWDAIKLLLQEGMDIQVHGHTHRFLDTCTSEELIEELAKPVKIFKDTIGHQITHLSLPGGRFNKKTLELAKNLGYLTISTSLPGLNHIEANNKFKLLKRNAIHQGIDISEFQKIIQGDYFYMLNANLKYLLKKYVKILIGNNLYQRIWIKVMNYHDQ